MHRSRGALSILYCHYQRSAGLKIPLRELLEAGGNRIRSQARANNWFDSHDSAPCAFKQLHVSGQWHTVDVVWPFSPDDTPRQIPVGPVVIPWRPARTGE